MKARLLAGAVGASIAVGVGAFLIPAAGNSTAATTTHTIKFTAVAQKQANLSKTSFAQDEVDRNKAGKIIGFDVIYGSFNPKTNTATGRVALSTQGGILYGSLHFTNGPVTTGRVTGGTGKFRGVTGTIYGKSINKAGTRTAVVITYHK